MNAQKQIDSVTESKRGGKREHAGAKLKHGEPTDVIRLPVSMIKRIKNGDFDNVTNSNNAELETYKTANAKLVEERDKYYQRVIELENQNRDLKRQPDKLRAEITRLKNLEHDCQAIKANGDRCDKPAKGKVSFHGVLINVCLQHQNQLSKR